MCSRLMQALDLILSNAQEDTDSEEETDELSEEEDGVEYNPEHDASTSEEEEIQAERETFQSNGKITWSSAAEDQHGRMAGHNVPKMTPGPTTYAVSHADDIASTFSLFITPAIENIILEMTNLEGSQKYGESWKRMDETDLQAYIGLLILSGVYRSQGEATESLWSAESGRAIFSATMPLKRFHAYSRLLRFDNRESRPARRASDKLAAIREVWDKWVERLPCMYNPGPDVTVDEQLVPFRGRCPFRQYIPSKPATYGIKLWVACDAKTSYAWKMQVYTGKATSGAPEKNQGMRVVLDVTEGLRGHNVTCDNFFTSYELGQELLKRKITLVGRVRKNKPELPPALLASKEREVLSSKFAFTPTTTVVSYIPKKNKNVLLLSTLHREADISDREDRKPAMILDYNSKKGGVDNLDKLVGTYSCRRKTARWPLVVFHNIIDVSSYNAFVIWREIYPSWMPSKKNKRRVFLEQLGKALVTPLIQRREYLPRTEASAAVVKAVQRAHGQPEDPAAPATAQASAPATAQASAPATAQDTTPALVPATAKASAPALAPATAQVTTPALVPATAQATAPALAPATAQATSPALVPATAQAFDLALFPAGASKRKRCQFCPQKNKTHAVCYRCNNYICRGCALVYCPICAD